MEKTEKNKIKAKAYNQALQNFEISYLQFLQEPTLGNYIECKTAQEAFLNCQKNCLSNKTVKEFLDGVQKNNYRCFAFDNIKYFDEMIEIRKEREISSRKLMNYLVAYENNAKKMGKKIKHNYSDLFINFIDTLDEIELATKVGRKFPKESYVKLPAPSNLKLTDLKRLTDYEVEFGN